MEIAGLVSYGVSFLIFVGIYGILALGLNMQWGFTGQFNIGVAGFFAVGAYSSAILTTAVSPNHLGGFGQHFLVGVAGAVIIAGLLGLLIGLITARLRTDYLAIATIGIAEILRLIVTNEDWLTNGVRGMAGIGRPFSIIGMDSAAGFLLLVCLAVVLVFFLVERARCSPWGRVLRAIRDNETAAAAVGKNVARFRLEAFVAGSAIMGLGGALYAHYYGFLSPEAFMPVYGTFLVWVMLIVGGSGNNRGALLGALVVWLIWSGTDFVTSAFVPDGLATQAGALRVLLIGVLLQVILLTRPQGILPEKAPPLTPGGGRRPR
ncbi:MAG: branched-chain amino acid ABC transporter permease [Aquisalimonadaceae bacterium]